MTTVTVSLCPAQRSAFDALLPMLPAGTAFWLEAPRPGLGRSTVLSALCEATGGTLITLHELLDALAERHPHAVEEAFFSLVLSAMQSNEHVFIDDLDLLDAMTRGLPGYPRSGLFTGAYKALIAYATQHKRKLIAAGALAALRPYGFPFAIREYNADDYAALCRVFLGDGAETLDIARIFRAAPKLSAHQLKSTCAWFALSGGLSTERLIAYLETLHLVTNVDLSEVQAVDLHDLKGIDDLIESLEANIILPLENEALAAELQLQPKRGVLLAGPPGTGKTTIGRALAHRLKGRFFLVDGTFISGTPQFYQRIQQVFEVAKQNFAAVLFIDDSDVIFESGQEAGLYRYLLTMLDGLESKSAGRVCVVLTAMDVANLPPALLRSGRIELWLETRLPDAAARSAILEQHLAPAGTALAGVDLPALAAATDGLTGADLKRLVADGKTALAFDRTRNRPLRPITDYFVEAIGALRVNKERYAQAEARARAQRPQRPQWFDVAAGGAMQAGADNAILTTSRAFTGAIQAYARATGAAGPATPPPGASLEPSS